MTQVTSLSMRHFLEKKWDSNPALEEVHLKAQRNVGQTWVNRRGTTRTAARFDDIDAIVAEYRANLER